MSYGVPGVPLIHGQARASVPFEQPKNLFRYGEQSLWSTQFHDQPSVLANGTFRLFNVPIGQVGQGSSGTMSIAETNLKEGGRIPNGVAYDVFGLAAQVLALTNTDAAGGTLNAAFDGTGQAAPGDIGTLVNIINNAALAWDFTQTQVDIAPLHLIGAGGGTFGGLAASNPAATAVADTGNLSNGAGSIWLYRKHPVALPGSSTFSVLLRYGNRARAIGANEGSVAIRVVLFGYFKNIIEIG